MRLPSARRNIPGLWRCLVSSGVVECNRGGGRVLSLERCLSCSLFLLLFSLLVLCPTARGGRACPRAEVTVYQRASDIGRHSRHTVLRDAHQDSERKMPSAKQAKRERERDEKTRRSSHWQGKSSRPLGVEISNRNVPQRTVLLHLSFSPLPTPRRHSTKSREIQLPFQPPYYLSPKLYFVWPSRTFFKNNQEQHCPL